jgi:glycosyltransferase involved in cell wall biosynthesis
VEHEVILVDDGSTDTTVEEIRQFGGEEVKAIVFNRNYGQTSALAAGIAEAQGALIATMDGDLQNDAADLPLMTQKLYSENWDMVAGNRKNRQDGMILRKIPSRIANGMIRWLTGVKLRDYGCAIKVFRAEYAKGLDLYGELHRFIPVLAHLQGARITDMDVRHHARQHGKSKYGLGRTSKVMSDLLLMLFFQKYFRRPIHLFGPLGIGCFVLGVLINFYLLIVKLSGQEIGGRPLLLLGMILLVAGIQFITFGIIVELMQRIYFESQRKTPYRIKEIIQGEAQTSRIS